MQTARTRRVLICMTFLNSQNQFCSRQGESTSYSSSILPSISRMKSICLNSTSFFPLRISAALYYSAVYWALLPIFSISLQHPHLAINEIDCRFKILIISISMMRKSNNLALFVAFAIMLSLVSGCTVCGNCTNCGPEIIADTYLDGINSLLQGKVQQLGFPLTIGRNKTSSSITYQIQYSSGLLISLRLNLDNMQIQLLSYSINGNLPTASTTSSSSASASVSTSQNQAQIQVQTQVRPIYKSTSDGFYIVENYTNSTEVTQIMTYLSSTFKNTLSNFQLVGAEFTNKSQTIYRLKLKFLAAPSGLSQIIQLVFVQYVSPNNCLLIDSNYSSLNFTGSFNTVDTKTILNDPWFSSINTLLVKKYSNLLGNYPQIASLQEAQPYFKIVYQVADTNYSFIVLYDYFQNRILQGNLTSLKTVTTYTQAQYQSSNGNPSTSTLTNSVSGLAQGQGSILSSTSSASSTSSLAETSSSTTTSSSTQRTVVNSAQSDLSRQASAKLVNPSPPSSVQPVLSATATSVNSQASNSQTAAQSQTLDIPNFKSNPQVISAVSFLNSLGQSFTIDQVQSVQKFLLNGLIYYKVTILITSVGSITLNSEQVIFYQYVLQVNSGGSLSVSNTSYTNLNNPNFALLTLDEVKKDQNIKTIARFLLSQQYPMLGSDSRVLAVYRDIPYYRIVFQGPSNIQLNYVIVLNFNGTVQVLSATSAQDQSQQSQTQSQSTLSQAQTQTQITATSQSQNQASQVSIQGINTGSLPSSSSNSQTISSSQTTSPSTISTQSSSSQTLNTPPQSISTASYQSYQQTQAVTFPQSQQNSSTQSTQNSQVSSTQSVDANIVQLQPVKSVTSQSNTAKTASTTSIQTVEIKQTIEGFVHFGGPTDPLYSYVTQGMAKINETLISKGYNVGQINYKDIIQKLEGNLLTVLFKIQTGGLLFTYQYKGNIGSTYTLSNSLTPSPVQTSSDTTVTLPGTQSIIVKSINYQLAPSSITNQPFIKYYLEFLDSSDICYSKQNLIGIYYNTQSQNSLLFRYKNSTQYYNIATSTADIQRILTIYLGDKKQALLQTQTTADQSSNIQSATTQGQSSTTTASISTNAPSGNAGVTNNQQSSQTIALTGINSQAALQGNSQSQQQITVQQSSSSSNQQAGQTSQQTNLVNQPVFSQPIQPTQPVITSTNTQTATSAPIVQPTTSTTSNQDVINAQIIKGSSSSQIIIPQQTVTQTSQSTLTNSQTTQKPSSTKPYTASQNIISANVDPHCLCYELNKCIKCAHRFYLNNNHCVQVPNQCLSYDINTGVCLKCLPGFTLQNGLCELSSTVAYYFNNQCFECLGDYRLVNKKCVYAPNIDPASPAHPQIKNPLCMSWSSGNCQQCLPGTYLSSRKVCELIDPFCSVFDYATEICNTCQLGYSIRNGRCFIKQ